VLIMIFMITEPSGPKTSIFFGYTIKAAGKTIFHSSWVTDIPVTQNNVKTLVVGGRSRWKIENEYFNTLKNQGHNAEHNYGHGTQYA